MRSSTLLGVAAATGAAVFVGYCVYFDKKRRSDPLFKQKLKERRKQSKEQKSSQKDTKFPDLKDTEAMQRFFLQEIQLGEELLATGDIDNGVDHIINAVAVCGQPQQLLQVLQQTLPPNVFQMLIQKLPSVGQRLQSSMGDTGPPGMMMGEPGPPGMMMGEPGPRMMSELIEDDIE